MIPKKVGKKFRQNFDPFTFFKMFTVYSKENCPFCTKVITVLKLTKQEYEVKKYGVDFDRDEFYDMFGEGSSFPQVKYLEQNLGGSASTIKFLREEKFI